MTYLMPTFDYTADDDRGHPSTGRITAPAWSDAREALRQRGWIVRTLQLTGDAAAAETSVLTVDALPPTPRPQPRPLSLTLSLQALAEELPLGRGGAGLAAIARRLESGQPLQDALQQESGRLPAVLRGLIALGLPTGRVDFLVNDYLDQCRRNADLRRSFRVCLAYPLLLLMLLFTILAFLLMAIVPMFAQIFADFGTELPWLTMFTVELSRTLLHSWLPILLAALVLAAAAYGLLRWLGGPGGPQTVWRSIPVLGQGFRWASLSNLCRLLAMLVELEIPLPQALRAAADVSDDYSLADRARRAATAIENGQPPREAVALRGYWLAELGPAFHWAGRGDDFVESLRAASEVFGARSRVQTNLVLWVIEPVLLVTLAVSVGTLVLALFLPLLKLLNDLR